MMEKLTEKYVMDHRRRKERKEYLGISPEDEKAVAELSEAAERFAPQFAQGFYRHLLAHAATARFLEDEQLVDRLKQEQMHYFHELVSGEYDEAYFERRLRVGEAHERVGLEPSWYLGAYNQYIQLCFPYFAEATGGRANPVLLALTKIILLDIGLTLETYFAEATERLRRRNNELVEALNMYRQAELRAAQYAKLAGHEVRGALNAIGNACEVVEEDFGEGLTQQAREILVSARQRCWATGRVVEGILAEPEHAGQRGWIVVARLLDEIVERIEVYKDLYGVAGEVQLDLPDRTGDEGGEPVRIWGDPIGLREVFANLVSNAIKHLDKEPARIAIEYWDDQAQHVFCVADNGKGISQELQGQLFQPMLRRSEADRSQGRGLGLHFVRAIVEQHGGRVWFESGPGVGSRFYFSLPKQPAQADET